MTIQQSLSPGKYKLRIEDYARLGDAGAFGDARTELIEGEIIVMSPEWRPHMRVKDELAYRIRRVLEGNGSTLFVGTGGSVALGEYGMPRPDILLTDDIDGEDAVPGASVALIVEVSASTLDYDRGEKAKLYAAAGMPEYWIVDVAGKTIRQMWAPAGDNYAEQREVAFNDILTAQTVAGLTIETGGF